ncbi:hypothetical protein F383_38744 [Gossypium arboreum]|uniref:Uncharacterized protein n=1 Tax=Gossypium arboreum TaxID=29729 RepID=A0A0B0MGV5_GOSAR|nr:hypothetical protein F383_38744 [Gossypium arboreum]
MELQINIY